MRSEGNIYITPNKISSSLILIFSNHTYLTVPNTEATQIE